MPRPIKLGERALEEVSSFIYLGSNVDTEGGTDKDIRINKARTTYALLRKVWDSRQISRSTKIRIFNSNVKSILFYGAETWRFKPISEKFVHTFMNRCLRRILRIWWPNRISNQDLWQQTNQLPQFTQIQKRKWQWIGHTLRKDPDTISRQTLQWNPQGKSRQGRPKNTWRGRPKNTWRRSVLDEMRKAAKNRVRWREIVLSLCSTQGQHA